MKYLPGKIHWIKKIQGEIKLPKVQNPTVNCMPLFRHRLSCVTTLGSRIPYMYEPGSLILPYTRTREQGYLRWDPPTVFLLCLASHSFNSPIAGKRVSQRVVASYPGSLFLTGTQEKEPEYEDTRFGCLKSLEQWNGLWNSHSLHTNPLIASPALHQGYQSRILLKDLGVKGHMYIYTIEAYSMHSYFPYLQ